MKEKFNTKTYSIGNSIVVTIPSLLIRQGKVENKISYTITIETEKEVKEK